MSSRDPSCLNCQFRHSAYTHGGAIDVCRRFPPTVKQEGFLQSRFPVVGVNDWCGEWDPERARKESGAL